MRKDYDRPIIGALSRQDPTATSPPSMRIAHAFSVYQAADGWRWGICAIPTPWRLRSGFVVSPGGHLYRAAYATSTRLIHRCNDRQYRFAGILFLPTLFSTASSSCRENFGRHYAAKIGVGVAKPNASTPRVIAPRLSAADNNSRPRHFLGAPMAHRALSSCPHPRLPSMIGSPLRGKFAPFSAGADAIKRQSHGTALSHIAALPRPDRVPTRNICVRCAFPLGCIEA